MNDALAVRLSALLALIAPGLAPGAEAEPTLTPDPQHGMVLFLKRCAACHGRHAWGDGPREIPALAGQGENYLTEQLRRFANGQRQGSDMHGPAMHESAELPDVNRAQALGDLSDFLSRAAANPRPENGSGESVARGERLYAAQCVSCHGDHGAGNDQLPVPAIGGQHYSYLVSRLRGFLSGSDHPVGSAALSPEDQRAVADYVSRLPYLRAAR